MGMPITVKILDKKTTAADLDTVYDYFTYIDNKFSTYLESSEISQINSGLLKKSDYSEDMRKVLALCQQTKQATNGYFEIEHLGKLDPSGLVKGWAINNAARLLKTKGLLNFYINAGGDIQVSGRSERNAKWRIGIENPFNRKQIIKAVIVDTEGVATSGTYIRGQHVYNPKQPNEKITDIVSLTVIGPDIYEADRFATAAFAMGRNSIYFLEKLPSFAGFMVDKDGIGTETSNFKKFVTS